MIASVQKSGKAHTNATELRETRLAITENTGKKDVYISKSLPCQTAHGVRRQIIWKHTPKYVKLKMS